MLEKFLVAQIFTFIMIFCRVGSAVMVLPGIGESYVSARIRLVFALMLSLLLTPTLIKTMPGFPASPLSLLLLILAEITIGLFIGAICRVLISATHVAGMIFSYQASLTSAVIHDVTQSAQGSLIGNFLGVTVVVLLFSTGLDALMLRGIAGSYVIFMPGHFPPLGAFVETYTRILADTFMIAVQISTPFLVGATLLFLGAGVLARLMPNIQIFFLIQAPQVILAFFLLIAVFGAMMLWYMEFFQEKLEGFFAYLR